jgi:DNA-binding transcriptional regulator YhcF (GntR family)
MSLILAGTIKDRIPSVRDPSALSGAAENTTQSARTALLEAGYLGQYNSSRYYASIPERIADPDLTRLMKELIKVATRSGATSDDLRHLVTANTIVPELADPETGPDARLLRPTTNRLRSESNRSRRPRQHRNGDAPASWSQPRRTAGEHTWEADG